ncbi:MAG: peptidoglycan-binding protein [Cyanobacteria bacterium P01_D01_bin.116]
MATQTQNPTLKNGSQGEDVKKVQQILNVAINANLTVDGVFGSNTEKAVKQFQTNNNLSSDGVVGPQTWAALNEFLGVGGSNLPTLSHGSKGDIVKALQQDLNLVVGANLVVDGIFGDATLKAVKEFQTKNNLSADGVVGPITWTALNEMAARV